MNPVVSVIIPVHNGAGTITKAIDSALIQDISLEILVVDDASEDNLEEVLSPYLSESRIKLFRNEPNIGAAGSRNRGVREARGKYVAFLDCDDWWEKDKLKKQLAMIHKTRCILCSTGRRLITPEGIKTDRIISVKQSVTYKDLLRHNPINCSSVLLRRDVALEFPMTHDEYHEDYITWLKILKKYKRACAVNEPLLNYRLSNTGKSGSKLSSAYKTFMVYRCLGFSMPKAIFCFISYTINGLLKYSIKNRVFTKKTEIRKQK